MCSLESLERLNSWIVSKRVAHLAQRLKVSSSNHFKCLYTHSLQLWFSSTCKWSWQYAISSEIALCGKVYSVYINLQWIPWSSAVLNVGLRNVALNIAYITQIRKAILLNICHVGIIHAALYMPPFSSRSNCTLHSISRTLLHLHWNFLPWVSRQASSAS
jgi:hypothetical protein